MIQRIQSVFLLLAAVGFAGLLKLPFASSNMNQSPIFEDGLFNVFDNSILLVLCIAGAALALINIFLFKNRELQLRIGYLLIICSIFLPLVAIWSFYTIKENFSADLNIADSIGLYLPIVSLVGAILANRFISKDKKLVSSMDRLR